MRYIVKFRYIGDAPPPLILTNDESWNGRETYMRDVGNKPLLYSDLNKAYYYGVYSYDCYDQSYGAKVDLIIEEADE